MVAWGAEMSSLKTIIESSAACMLKVSVVVRPVYGQVTIKDLSGQHEDIFLQGCAGSAFISELNFLWHTTDQDKNSIALYLARAYTQLWE